MKELDGQGRGYEFSFKKKKKSTFFPDISDNLEMICQISEEATYSFVSINASSPREGFC